MPLGSLANPLGGGFPEPSGAASIVGGPGSSTDNAIARFDGTTGDLIQNSTATLSDTGTMGIGGATTAAVGLGILNTALTGTVQAGIASQATFSSAATSQGIALYSNVRTAAAAYTVAAGFGLNADVPTIGAGSAITTLCGVYIANQGASGVTNAYGIDIAAQSGAATINIGLRNAGTTSLTNATEATIAGAGALITSGGIYATKKIISGTAVFDGSAATSLTGGAGNMTIVAGTGNSRTLALQTTTSGGTATNAIVIGDTQVVTSYKNVATEGDGLMAVRKVGRITAQSAAGTIATLTTPAADSSYRVSANMLVISAVALSTTVNVDYTDEGNNARTMIMPLSGLAGSFVAGGLATAAGPFESPAMHIRTKASTTITVSTAAGTFTTVSYNAEAVITQLQ